MNLRVIKILHYSQYLKILSHRSRAILREFSNITRSVKSLIEPPCNPYE